MFSLATPLTTEFNYNHKVRRDAYTIYYTVSTFYLLYPLHMKGSRQEKQMQVKILLYRREPRLWILWSWYIITESQSIALLDGASTKVLYTAARSVMGLNSGRAVCKKLIIISAI